jgi:hypothetical protein
MQQEFGVELRGKLIISKVGENEEAKEDLCRERQTSCTRVPVSRESEYSTITGEPNLQ